MNKVQLEQSEARAVLRAVEGLQASAQAGEVSLEEASRLFEAYDKVRGQGCGAGELTRAHRWHGICQRN